MVNRHTLHLVLYEDLYWGLSSQLHWYLRSKLDYDLYEKTYSQLYWQISILSEVKNAILNTQDNSVV